jgi:hypothetical protein
VGSTKQDSGTDVEQRIAARRLPAYFSGITQDIVFFSPSNEVVYPRTRAGCVCHFHRVIRASRAAGLAATDASDSLQPLSGASFHLASSQPRRKLSLLRAHFVRRIVELPATLYTPYAANLVIPPHKVCQLVDICDRSGKSHELASCSESTTRRWMCSRPLPTQRAECSCGTMHNVQCCDGLDKAHLCSTGAWCG